MAFDLGRKCRPQHAPGFVSFLPGRDFLDVEARQRHQERRVEIGPHGIASEEERWRGSHGVFSVCARSVQVASTASAACRRYSATSSSLDEKCRYRVILLVPAASAMASTPTARMPWR